MTPFEKFMLWLWIGDVAGRIVLCVVRATVKTWIEFDKRKLPPASGR